MLNSRIFINKLYAILCFMREGKGLVSVDASSTNFARSFMIVKCLVGVGNDLFAYVAIYRSVAVKSEGNLASTLLTVVV